MTPNFSIRLNTGPEFGTYMEKLMAQQAAGK